MLYVFRAIIISGSGESVNGTAPLSYDPHLFQLGVPVLGICYGFHLIVKHFGGLVSREDVREDGQFEVTVDSQGIFESLEKEQKVLLTHGDSVKTVSEYMYIPILISLSLSPLANLHVFCSSHYFFYLFSHGIFISFYHFSSLFLLTFLYRFQIVSKL